MVRSYCKSLLVACYSYLGGYFLVVFLPQNVGLLVGTYNGLLPFCECTWGAVSISMWWGHLTTVCDNQTFGADK